MIRLKELRIEKGLSQEEVGKAINATQRSVGRWEQGTHEPNSAYLISLARLFGCSVDYLICNTDEWGNSGTEEATLKTPDVIKMVRLYNGLDECQKQALLLVAELFSKK